MASGKKPTVQLRRMLSLTEAAKVALDHWFDPEKTVPLEDAYWKFLESLDGEGLRDETVR